ncbi:MAG: glutaredoxin 3 [Rhodospirillales bacterium]|nr:glutaredoxin 3 [Rhodospirillales bacterium]
MAKIEIYTSPWCGYCVRAKKLLQTKGVEFIEIDVEAEPRRKPEMVQRAHGGRTVPQIFIDDRHVGGSDDLHALDARGELDLLLA